VGFRLIRPIPVSRLFLTGDTVRVIAVRLTVRGVALAVRCVARLAFGLTVLVVRRGRLVADFLAVRPDELERVERALDFRPLDLERLVERLRERLFERPPELRPRLERPRRAIIL
jgi:antitoxin (DNA-binding transcriptional repressor) of toxin-antitoxin stability system